MKIAVQIAFQVAFALVNGKMCQASAESLGQSVKNSYPVCVVKYSDRDNELKVPPSKKGWEGHWYPIDLATMPPITFFFVSL